MIKNSAQTVISVGTSDCNCQMITELPYSFQCAFEWMCNERSSGTESIYQRAEPSCYMHVLIFVATCIEHIWFCCNISFVFTTGIHELKRVEAILSSFRKDMAFSLYKSWNRLCEIDAYECTYFFEQTIYLISFIYIKL